VETDRFPEWLKGLVIGLASCVAGAVLAAAYSATQRTQLHAQIAGLRAELTLAQERLAAKDHSLAGIDTQLAALRRTSADLSAELVRIKAQLPAAADHAPPTMATGGVPTTAPVISHPTPVSASESAGRQVPEAQPAQAAEADDQCTAITQKGTRCKRKARSNGRCWQHGG